MSETPDEDEDCTCPFIAIPGLNYGCPVHVLRQQPLRRSR